MWSWRHANFHRRLVPTPRVVYPALELTDRCALIAKRVAPLYLAPVPAPCTRDATFDYTRITLGIQSRIVSIPNHLFRFLKRPLNRWVGNGGTFVVRFARDGIEEVETSNSNSRTRNIPYNSRFSNRAKINGFVCFCSFFSFFFLTLYRSIKKPIGSVQNKRGKQNLSKQFDNRGAGEGRLSSNRYQNFLLTWNLTWNLRLYTCPLTANLFSQK